MTVDPLSLEAVERLASGTGSDPTELHRRTGGNAFFVTECVASGGEVPESLRDAVLARVEHLDGPVRAALDVVSAAPARMELWLAERLGASLDGIDGCITRGLLLADGEAVRFRHELAREAIHEVLPPGVRRVLHRSAATALAQPPGGDVDHARVVHHALAGGDDGAVLRHAPRAAATATAAGARREAVAHLEAAVARSGRLRTERRRQLWAQLADERSALGAHDAAIQAYETAIAIAAEAGDDLARGALLARMWTPLSMSGRVDRAGEVAAAATDLLSTMPPGAELALALAQRCAQHMLARQLTDAERWGRAAIDLAEQVGASDTLAYALIQSGVALWMGGAEEGLDRLREGVRTAEEVGSTALVAQGLSQIGSGGGEIRRYGEAVAALEACIAHADVHELGSRGTYASAWLGRCQLELGRWDEAAARLTAVLRSSHCDGISRVTALTSLGRLRVRRGDPDGKAPLEEARRLAAATGHLQRTWPVTAGLAEVAWLEGRLDSEVAALERMLATASDLDHAWAVGEIGFWLWRAGVPVDVSARTTPFHLQALGDLAGAASAWERLGCPYEQATALADSDDDGAQLRALEIFRELGARPAFDRLVGARAAVGRSVPRGPNTATRANPAGLTARELDVLALVAVGRTNREIAAELIVSPKTVGHHVSHILTKLGARSRAEAVTAAIEHGIPLSRESHIER